jgi:hypothetical protein
MEMIVDIFVVVVGWLLAAGALVYGCMHVAPGSWARWLVFVAGAVIVTQFGWLPLLGLLGLRVTVADQYVALALATVGLKLLMEKALPWLVWSVEVDEVSE